MGPVLAVFRCVGAGVWHLDWQMCSRPCRLLGVGDRLAFDQGFSLWDVHKGVKWNKEE